MKMSKHFLNKLLINKQIVLKSETSRLHAEIALFGAIANEILCFSYAWATEVGSVGWSVQKVCVSVQLRKNGNFYSNIYKVGNKWQLLLLE